MSDEGTRAASRDAWGGAACEWARAAEEPERGASAVATEWMLAAAEPRPGDRVLELACGAGRVGLAAAERVGPEGLVVCSDFAEPMVAAAREGAARRGLANVEARVLDAEGLELAPDERFDAVLCRFGYMLMSEPLRALRSTAGALVPEGRVVLAVWGTAEENPWLATILGAVMDHFDAPPPEPGTPGPFALADGEGLRGLLAEAGFADVEVERLPAEQPYDSPEAWWEQIPAVGGPLGTLLSSLPQDDVEAIRRRALEEASGYRRSDGTAAFPATIVGARGVRPPA